MNNKKHTGRLYFQILANVAIAAIISIGVWYFFANVTLIFQTAKDEEFLEFEKDEFDELADYYESIILDQNLTAEAFATGNFLHSYIEYDVQVVSCTGTIIDAREGEIICEASYFDKTYLYPIIFQDGNGFIAFHPNEVIESTLFNDVFAVVFALLAFIAITIFTIKKPLNYIQAMDAEISYLARGELDHKLTISGNNELTNLALSINEMSTSLKQMIEKEKIEDQKQRSLITNLSHDLRTPLTSIMGYLNVLSDKKYSTEADADEYVKRALAKSDYLNKLLTELFNYTKLTNGDISFAIREINLNHFITNYLKTTSLDVSVDLSKATLLVDADPDWLTRILDKLFENIQKHGNLNKNVLLSTYQHEDETIVGLKNYTKEDLTNKVSYLFDRTYVGNEARTNASSGLGLTIVAESMIRMGASASASYKNGELIMLLKFPKK